MGKRRLWDRFRNDEKELIETEHNVKRSGRSIWETYDRRVDEAGSYQSRWGGGSVRGAQQQQKASQARIRHGEGTVLMLTLLQNAGRVCYDSSVFEGTNVGGEYDVIR